MNMEKTKQLKSKRQEMKKSRKEIAELLGVTYDTITKWENGERIPKDKHKVKLAEIYKTTIMELFY